MESRSLQFVTIYVLDTFIYRRKNLSEKDSFVKENSLEKACPICKNPEKKSMWDTGYPTPAKERQSQG